MNILVIAEDISHFAIVHNYKSYGIRRNQLCIEHLHTLFRISNTNKTRICCPKTTSNYAADKYQVNDY